MHIRFELAGNTTSAFRYLRVSLLKMHFEKWAQRHNIRDFQFISHEGTVRIQFKHMSEYSIFALAWDGYPYTMEKET